MIGRDQNKLQCPTPTDWLRMPRSGTFGIRDVTAASPLSRKRRRVSGIRITQVRHPAYFSVRVCSTLLAVEIARLPTKQRSRQHFNRSKNRRLEIS